MIVFKRTADLKHYLTLIRKNSSSVGFVPTMGSLHEGHISLVKKSLDENDLTVCSIFVNPKQFNETSDLKNYPRPIGTDMRMLSKSGNHVLFLPDIDDIYPSDLKTKPDLDISHLAMTMEGQFRSGHFEGMIEVVHRLLNLVEPDKLYMGQKDYQQFAIVQYMIQEMGLGVDLIMCSIIRESDGLAMSSRNRRLDPEIRKEASIIYKTLNWAKKELANGKEILWIAQEAMKRMAIPSFKPEYFSIIDGHTLASINSISNNNKVVACTAVWAGKIRLIDNMIMVD